MERLSGGGPAMIEPPPGVGNGGPRSVVRATIQIFEKQPRTCHPPPGVRTHPTLRLRAEPLASTLPGVTANM